MTSTQQLQKEYAELHNKYMTVDNSEELRSIREKLSDYEEKLTIRFMLESGYDIKETEYGTIYVKKEGVS